MISKKFDTVKFSRVVACGNNYPAQAASFFNEVRHARSRRNTYANNIRPAGADTFFQGGQNGRAGGAGILRDNNLGL